MTAVSFSADSNPSAVALRDEIRTRRDAGVVHLEYRHVDSATDASPHDVVTAFVESLGLTPSLPWDELDVDRALAVATCVLHQDLAYRVDLMPLEEAAALARRFIESCGGTQATFVTNGTLGLQRGGGAWNPLTTATFDTGVVAVSPDRARVAILWVEDED